MLISQLPFGQKFKLDGFDSTYERIKKPSVGPLVYIKKGLKDLYYCADKPVKQLID